MTSRAHIKASPLDLPVIPRESLSRLNTAARKREAWHGSAGNDPVTVRTALLEEIWQAEDFWIALHITVNETPAQICIPFAILEEQLQHIDESLDLETLDDESRGILVEVMFEPLLHALEEQEHIRIKCSGVDFTPDHPPQDAIGLWVEYALFGNRPFVIVAPPALHGRLEKWIKNFPLERNNSKNIPVTISFRAGYAMLTLDELIGIRPGDGIMLDENSVTQKSVIAITGEHFAQTCMVTSHGLELTAPLLTPITGNLKGWTFMNNQDDSYPGDNKNEPGAVGQINVRLVFEVGRQDLTVKDLQEINAGHIFDLGRPLDQAVDILAGGRQIGAGELVRVGNQIGVRVDWILK